MQTCTWVAARLLGHAQIKTVKQCKCKTKHVNAIHTQTLDQTQRNIAKQSAFKNQVIPACTTENATRSSTKHIKKHEAHDHAETRIPLKLLNADVEQSTFVKRYETIQCNKRINLPAMRHITMRTIIINIQMPERKCNVARQRQHQVKHERLVK